MKNQKKSHQSLQTRMFMGQLMSPEDVVAAMADRTKNEKEQVGSRWMFCCDVLPDMFDAMRHQNADQVGVRATAFRSSLGGTYGVLTHQVHGHQHRMLLPMYDAEVQRAIASVVNVPFGFLMGNNNQVESIILPSHVAGHDLQGFPASGDDLSHEGLEVLIGELPMVVSALAEPERISSLNGAQLQSLSLSIVMPLNSMIHVEDKRSELA